MTIFNLNLKSRQQGAATLIVVLVLAMVMGVVSLTTTRTGMMEQKIVGNDLRAREAQEAAEAGLESGIALAWQNRATLTATTTCTSWPSSSLPTGCPATLPSVTGSSTGESYNYNLTYTVNPTSIKVTSAARGSSDTSIMANSEAWIKKVSWLSDSGLSAPPFVVNGTAGINNGNPNAYNGTS